MTSISNLQRLAYQLEQSARSGGGVQLSQQATELLLVVVRACGETDEASEQTPVAYAFRVIARDGEGRFEEVLARSSDFSIAKAMFDAAVRQSPQQSVRLMKDFEVLEETGPRKGRSKWRPGNEIERSIFGA